MFYMVMATFAISSAVIFLFLKQPIIISDPELSPLNTPHIQNRLSTESAYDTILMSSTDVFSQHPQVKPVTSFIQEIKEYFRFMFQKRMLYILPSISWTGISISIYTGLLIPIIVSTLVDSDENDKLMKSFFAMVSLGVGEIVGGLAIGYVIDKVGNKLTSIISIASIILQTIVVITYIGLNQFGFLAFAMTFLWGVQDSIINTHLAEILGFEFKCSIKPFLVFNFVQCWTAFLFLIIESFVKTKTHLIIFMIFSNTLGILTCLLSAYFPYSHVHGKLK